VHAGVQILTIGQYLQPSRNNLPVKRYYSPGEFRQLENRALNNGLKQVIAAPYVRSSYLAERNYQLCLAKD
jgi:lipoic acid synthetase